MRGRPWRSTRVWNLDFDSTVQERGCGAYSCPCRPKLASPCNARRSSPRADELSLPGPRQPPLFKISSTGCSLSSTVYATAVIDDIADSISRRAVVAAAANGNGPDPGSHEGGECCLAIFGDDPDEADLSGLGGVSRLPALAPANPPRTQSSIAQPCPGAGSSATRTLRLSFPTACAGPASAVRCVQLGLITPPIPLRLNTSDYRPFPTRMAPICRPLSSRAASVLSIPYRSSPFVAQCHPLPLSFPSVIDRSTGTRPLKGTERYSKVSVRHALADWSHQCLQRLIGQSTRRSCITIAVTYHACVLYTCF